mmetsp:Transcript_4322/g.7987  ORF Transcript_4322/g.7987 Transcript_4322/m.7987 type:complete len:84 (-) Transcript_4322:215-466(-)
MISMHPHRNIDWSTVTERGEGFNNRHQEVSRFCKTAVHVSNVSPDRPNWESVFKYSYGEHLISARLVQAMNASGQLYTMFMAD